MELIKPIDVPENEIFYRDCVWNSEPSLITVVGLYPCDRIMILREECGTGGGCGVYLLMGGSTDRSDASLFLYEYICCVISFSSRM